MKDELDMIFSGKEKDIETISSRYKAVDDKRKEKIYEISRRKYNILKAGESEEERTDDGFTVSAEGVERYNRPKLYRYFSAAAAAIVLFGGVCGGVLLSRSSKIQPMNPSSDPNVTASTVEGTKDALYFEDNAAVDKLLGNLEMIQRPQYPTIDCVDLSDEIYFNKDEFSDVAGDVVNLTKYYFAVTDERLDTMTEVNDVLREAFIYETANSYLGGDLSSHEVGYDFRDDSMANKYVKTFIEYNGRVYVQSQCEPNASYAYNFDGLYNFSNYKLVSSEFTNSGELLTINRIMYDENSEPVSLEKLVTCKRVYERPDGQRVTADIQLLPENDVWKIAAYVVSLQSDSDDTEYVESKLPILERKDASDDETGELQLHENIIYPSYEEAAAACAEIENDRARGIYSFNKVDVEKYSSKILGASGFDELNSLENKSYVYHLLLNSCRYFDTAELTFTLNIDYKDTTVKKTEHCLADNKGKYIYVDYEMDEPGYNNHLTLYSYDERWISADNISKTYSEAPYFETGIPEDYLPDNYRYIDWYDSDGVIQNYGNYSDIIFGQLGQDCLYTNTSYIHNFDTWYIAGTETILGRQCAVISIDNGFYTAEKYVDLRTGTVLKYSERAISSGDADDIRSMEVSSIKIDQPLDYIYFDPTGYTDESYN
ncbi:hypothetical protein [Ruminococcus flavefaciens]|uniref:hypothetical protein n=1 Tax=Ruminococcus flavefaciens TaxID=1265 RepID=UPI0026F2ADDA|nr:hypothetical protein [Ruminococcus flavefaciens]